MSRKVRRGGRRQHRQRRAPGFRLRTRDLKAIAAVSYVGAAITNLFGYWGPSWLHRVWFIPLAWMILRRVRVHLPRSRNRHFDINLSKKSVAWMLVAVYLLLAVTYRASWWGSDSIWWWFFVPPVGVGLYLLNRAGRLRLRTILFLGMAAAVCGWLASWGMRGAILAVFLLWRAVFWYDGLQRSPHGGADIPQGHAIEVEDSPHINGFFPLMWRWWVWPPAPAKEEKSSWRAAKQAWRIFSALSPITWFEFAFLGWPRIRYLVTKSPSGKISKAMLAFPQPKFLGVDTNTLSTDAARFGSAKTKPHTLGGTTFDPGVIIGEEQVDWPFAKRPRELAAVVGS